jgi:hypothetical protein
MQKKSSDPFSSTFSLLAGQGIASRPAYDLTHIEPAPDSPQYVIVAPTHHRRLGLIGLLLTLLNLG